MTLRPVSNLGLLTREELAGEMRISVPTLDRIRYESKKNGLPMPEVSWGRQRVLFRLPEVMAWWAEYEQRRAA